MSIDWDKALDQAADDIATFEWFSQLVNICESDMSVREWLATLPDKDRELAEYWIDRIVDWAIETWPDRDWAEYVR